MFYIQYYAVFRGYEPYAMRGVAPEEVDATTAVRSTASPGSRYVVNF